MGFSYILITLFLLTFNVLYKTPKTNDSVNVFLNATRSGCFGSEGPTS